MPPGRFCRSFGQRIRIGHNICSFLCKTEQKMSFQEWFSTLLRLGLWQNSYVRYSLWLVSQLLLLANYVDVCHQNLQGSNFLQGCLCFLTSLATSWVFIDNIWRTNPEMFAIPHNNETTFFKKLSGIFSPIPVKEKSFYEWFYTEAPADYQVNSTEWILISHFIVFIMVVLVMLVMVLLLTPLLLWLWEKFQRRLLQRSRFREMYSKGNSIVHSLLAAWVIISVVMPWFFTFLPEMEPAVLERIFSYLQIPLKEEKTLFKWFYRKAPAGFQTNFTKWIMISYFIMLILIMPLLLWFWGKFQRRLLHFSRLFEIVSTGADILYLLPWAWTLISYVITWLCPFVPKPDPTFFERVLSYFWISLNEKCTLSLKCCSARSFLESTSYWIHSTRRFIQIWCFSLLKKVAINIDWKICHTGEGLGICRVFAFLPEIQAFFLLLILMSLTLRLVRNVKNLRWLWKKL